MKGEWIATGIYVAAAWIVYLVSEFSGSSSVEFLLSLVYMVVLLAGAIAMAIRLIVGLIRRRDRLAALAMVAAVLPFCFMLEIRELHARAEDYFLRDERTAVMEEIRAEAQEPFDWSDIKLPEGKEHLSEDGCVSVIGMDGDFDAALFWNFHGLLGGGWATVYCPGGGAPHSEMLGIGEVIACKPLGGGWYYVGWD